MNSSAPINRDMAENLRHWGTLTTHSHLGEVVTPGLITQTSDQKQNKNGLYRLSILFCMVQEWNHYIRNFLMDSNKQVMMVKTYYGLIFYVYHTSDSCHRTNSFLVSTQIVIVSVLKNKAIIKTVNRREDCTCSGCFCCWTKDNIFT